MPAVSAWVQTSLRRVFPTSPARDQRHLTLRAARSDRVSFQVGVRNSSAELATASLEVQAPDSIRVRTRRVGYVTMRHLNTDTPPNEQDGLGCVPGLVPDPLYDDSTASLGPHETQAFWVTCDVPAEAPIGPARLIVLMAVGAMKIPVAEATIIVCEPTIDLGAGIPVTHWFYADALCDWYKVDPWEERFWQIARTYMRDNCEHGGSCQYVPLFTPPTDGVKRPTQLLRVSEPSAGRYEFDFADVDRWLRVASEEGARYFEWTHFFSQWGVRDALRVYRDNADSTSLLWPAETGATSIEYRNFLGQFLPQFHAFLEERALTDVSLFHVSDEPHDSHIPHYRAARDMLRELAPWMKVCDALSDIGFGRDGLIDLPIPVISSARAFADEGIPSGAYFCCGPRGRFLNRLMDTPLTKIRMTGWLLHRFKARAFLHWGYNYWYRSQTQDLIDPFTEQSGNAWPGWAYGDPFVVYPGPDGPLDSIRWEVFGESMRDLALVRTLGLPADAPLLNTLQGYDDFPKTESWVESARRAVLED